MWIPTWLGQIYSSLTQRFGTGVFTLGEAQDVLGMGKGKLNVAFSKLHSVRVLTLFERSRPRVYRLVSPADFVLLASERVQGIEMVKQERYLPLVLGAFKAVSDLFELRSFALFGSVARGTARMDSDVDVLLVSDDFRGSVGSRIEGLMSVEEGLGDEIEWLSRMGVRTGLSFYPLRVSEAERLPDLFLDLTEDAIILYDEGALLEKILLELRLRLMKSGAERIHLDGGEWFWDLLPGYRYGDVIETDPIR